MKLKDILLNIPLKEKFDGDFNLNITSISFDSRNKYAESENAIFVCLVGENTDGHKFAADAIKNGAKVIVCERKLNVCKNEVVVNSTREALSLMASNFYSNPHKKMKMIAITGTNGKTTTTYMLKSILESAGHKVGLIGTEGAYIGKQFLPVNLTTPDPMDMQKLMAEMVEFGCEYCVMEASAHSIFHNKIYGIVYEVAIFSNLTQDHLEFFKTMENYGDVKMRLFSKKFTKVAVTNLDDEWGRKIESFGLPTISYALDNPADCFAIDIKNTFSGSKFVLNLMDNIIECKINLPGRFNIYNALAASSAAAALGIEGKFIAQGLADLKSVSGRFNFVKLANGASAVIDFAHTPDGIKNILTAIKELKPKRIITVFGCGGNRDKGKRPLMGQISEKLSDFTIITSDNPRFENPELIIDDVERGMTSDKFVSIVDRHKAVEIAINLARPGDAVAILGKGVEKYQDINGVKVPYCDLDVVNQTNDKIAAILAKVEGRWVTIC